jgi:hypothetical protein
MPESTELPVLPSLGEIHVRLTELLADHLGTSAESPGPDAAETFGRTTQEAAISRQAV